MFLGCVGKTFYSQREFFLVHHPVAEAGVVGVARIFVAEPAVVHYEQLAAQRCNVAHHLVHNVLRDVHVHTFPAVEEHHALAVAVPQGVLACPAVNGAAYAAFAFG